MARWWRRTKPTPPPTVGQVGTEIVVAGRRLWVMSVEMHQDRDGLTSTVICVDEQSMRRRFR